MFVRSLVRCVFSTRNLSIYLSICAARFVATAVYGRGACAAARIAADNCHRRPILMDHPARRSHAARWIRGQRNCIIAAATATLVLLMVRPVHMRDAGLPLVRILNRLLLAARAATSVTTATITVALATAAHLLRSSRGLLPVAAVLQD